MRSVFSRSFLFSILAVGALIVLASCSHSPDEFDRLVRGDMSISVTQLEIESHLREGSTNITILSGADSQYLTEAFRRSTVNQAGSFYRFNGKVLFSDGQQMDVQIGLTTNLECLIINKSEWSLSDPTEYRILLTQPIPAGLESGLRTVITPTK